MSNQGARYQRGTLTQSGDNWVVRIREDADGKRIERTHVVASLTEVRNRTLARSLADALVDRLTGRGLTAGATMGAAEYLRRYMAEHVISKKRASQSTINGRITKHIIPAVGRLRLEQVTVRTAQQMVSAMLAAGLHSTTIRDTVQTLARIVRKAKADGMACQPIDVKMVSMPAKVEADVERQVFTVDEVVKLISGSTLPWKLAYALQATCGLRCGEVLGLAWRDFEDSTVIVRRSAVHGRLQSLKSKASARRLAIAPMVGVMLAEYRSTWTPNAEGLLFATRTGHAFHGSWYRDVLADDLKRLGIPHRGTHAFRHFTATQLLKAGQSAATVRDAMRHTDIRTTNTYSHAVSGDLAKGAAQIGELIAGNVLTADVCGSGSSAKA